MLRPFIEKWQGAGIGSIIYLDNGILGDKSKTRTAHHCLTVRSDLENAGFLLNEEKCALHHTQFGEWIGFEIDTKVFVFLSPTTKN